MSNSAPTDPDIFSRSYHPEYDRIKSIPASAYILGTLKEINRYSSHCRYLLRVTAHRRYLLQTMHSSEWSAETFSELDPSLTVWIGWVWLDYYLYSRNLQRQDSLIPPRMHTDIVYGSNPSCKYEGMEIFRVSARFFVRATGSRNLGEMKTKDEN